MSAPSSSPAPAAGPRPRPIDTAGVMPTPRLRRLYRHVQPAVEALFEFPALWRLYDAASRPGLEGPMFAGAVLAELGVTWAIDAADLAAVRAVAGPMVVVSNHPHGGLDALAMVQVLELLRPGGWRMLSNQVVCSIPEFGPRLVAVDPLGRGAESLRINQQGLARAFRHLKAGEILGVFPAGRVSHRDRTLGAVCDRAWSDHVFRLAEKSGAHVACFHIPGQNSARFLRVPPAWSRLRALALCPEIVHPPSRHLPVRLAALLAPGDVRRLAATPGAGNRLRAQCFLRADRERPRPAAVAAPTGRPKPPVAEPEPVTALRAEVARIEGRCRLLSSPDGEIDVLLFQGVAAPGLLRALGRCREITFRAAGQGVGRPCDLSPEDDYYHHLVLWHRAQGGIIGAYRLGFTREIIAQRGRAALYLDHIFEFDRRFHDVLGPAIELSRSFVMPDSQRDNRALALLWRGLGAAAVRHGCPTLFGSVTISNDHHPASRALLVEHLQRNYADTPERRGLVRARRPFVPVTTYHRLAGDAYAGQPIDALAPVVETIEGGQRGIPPLMRYYCTVGAKYLAYHVEPSFQDALYCLLRVDLNAIPAAYRRKFLGDAPSVGIVPAPAAAAAAEPALAS